MERRQFIQGIKVLGLASLFIGLNALFKKVPRPEDEYVTFIVTCKFPFPMSEEQFKDHEKNMIDTNAFLKLDKKMRTEGTLISKKVIFAQKSIKWVHTFKNSTVLEKWLKDTEKLVDINYMNNSFSFERYKKTNIR